MPVMSMELASYLAGKRWFGGKGREISHVQCVASLPLAHGANWQILEVKYADGATELYQVPRSRNDDALADANVRAQVFSQLQASREIPGESTFTGGESIVTRIENFAAPPPATTSRLLAIEQSNSSVMFGEPGSASFLKVFRKLEGGINPDIEILSHLSRLETSVQVPKIYATIQLEYRGEMHALAVLLEMVANRGNAWETALAAARSGDRFLAEAALLGKRTAQMHLALAEETGDPAFGVVNSGADEWERTKNRVESESIQVRDLLLTRMENLSSESATLASCFLEEIPRQIERMKSLDDALTFPMTRVHGDYHLGQVLVTDDDFVIIDFEGEPARPLSERRLHRSPLIDVAGMLRSFHYAGCMAENFSWVRGVSKAFSDAYFLETTGSPILPDASATQTLLEVFSWQKKLYEIRYELNNRPDWSWIPLK